MESEKSINQKIVSITKKIQENYPELVKYLNEMPEHFLSNPDKGIGKEDLIDYFESLKELVENYSKEH